MSEPTCSCAYNQPNCPVHSYDGPVQRAKRAARRVELPRFTLAELFGRGDEQLRLATPLRECLKVSARIRSYPCGECEWCLAHLADPNRDVLDPAQPGGSFWPAGVEEHRRLLAELEAELKSALATIRALHRCPHCDRPLTGAGEAR